MRTFNPPWPAIPISQQIWRKAYAPYHYLAIEIGAGVGYHALRYCEMKATHFLVALERTQGKATKFLKRVHHHPPLANLYPLHADAITWISQNIQPKEVDHYFILYPNPYPKAKQANQRWVNMPFMPFLYNTLKIGGCITLATNQKFYYAEALDAFAQYKGLKIEHANRLPTNTQPRTHFEKKYLARGEACFEIKVRNYANLLGV